jgi:T-complex protein 1 subunit gamma
MMLGGGGNSQPIMVLNANTKRDQGKKAQFSNIFAAKTIADTIRTCLGPRAMLKMVLDPMGGIVLTNDGNAILREIQVQHPAGKSMIEISRTQDEEVGDGTTSVIILAGELLAQTEQYLQQGLHATVIIRAYRKALEDCIEIMKTKVSVPVDVKNREEMLRVVKTCIGTKYLSRWSDLACQISLDAVQTVMIDENGRREIDIKRYARFEKIPGGSIEDSVLLKGVMLNKDVVHPKMKRRVENPRIVLLDCSLEYKKGESQTSLEFSGEPDFTRMLQLEEESIRLMCQDVIAVKPDVVVTEKGISDVAAHYLAAAGISAVRRTKKSDNNRISRATGATIVNETSDLKEEDVGTGCGLFEIRKIGDEYYAFFDQCKNPKACTIILRGANKDVLNEIERNFQDAMNVTRNVMLEPRLTPGGGAVEMALSRALDALSNSEGTSGTSNDEFFKGVEKYPYKAVSRALEIIPRTLIQNCGGNVVKQLTTLRAKHHQQGDNFSWGIDGETGQLVDMHQLGIWEPIAVKMQTIKTAIETAILLLRIDDIVSGTKKASTLSDGPGQSDGKKKKDDEDNKATDESNKD